MMTYRAVVSSIVLAFILIAPSADVISYGVIAFAQAHFLMAYYYQYKAGKINKAYVLRYVFAFLVVFGSYYFYGPNNWPVFLMGAYFVIHFLYDERYLMSESTDFYGWFRLFPIMIACAPVVFSSLGFDIYAEAKIALFVLGGGYAGSRLVNRVPISSNDLYFSCVFAICCVLTFSEYVPNAGQAVSFIALSHYGNWYIHYIVRFRKDQAIYNKFIKEVLFVNALTMTLFFCYKNVDIDIFHGLKYFSQWDYFSLWTIMHFFSTFRSGDLMNWVPDTRVKHREEYGV